MRPSGHCPPGYAERSRFDWYRATVPAHPKLIVEAVADVAGGVVDVEHGKGRFNYLNSSTVLCGGDRRATVLHGGPNGHPNVEASGEQAEGLAALLRELWPAHRVTRADVAIDLHGPDAFARTEAVATNIAKARGLQLRKIASPIDRSLGETIYVGSRKSALFARVYEKGKADREHYGDVDAYALESWVRCELEVKPEKELKARAASLAPEEFWGCSDWTAQLAREALAMSPDPIPFQPRRSSTDDQSFEWMCSQYRSLLRRRVDRRHQGDRMALAREILERIYDEEIPLAS